MLNLTLMLKKIQLLLVITSYSIHYTKLYENYHETIMAAAGHAAEKALWDTVEKGKYVAVIEGGVPTAPAGDAMEAGAYGKVGGHTMLENTIV